MKKPHINFRIIGIVIAVTGILSLVYLNVTAPVTLTQQTYQTPIGTSTVVVSTCQSFPNVAGNTLCSLSKNIVNQSSNTSQNNNQIITPTPVIGPIQTMRINPTPSPVQQPTNKTTNTITDVICSNGGIQINNTCPLSVTPISSLPPTTPVTPNTKPSETIQIQPIITLTDNAGKISPITASGINLNLESLIANAFGQQTKLSFIAQTGSNDPISNGHMDLVIQIHASPNENINANGTLFTSINGNQLNTAGLFWAAKGMTNGLGNINATLSTPIGTLSAYDINIQSQSSLINQPTNPVIFSISNVMITNGKGLSYSGGTTLQTLFQSSLDYDPNLIISQNSAGQYVRVYPLDDTLTISSLYTQTNSYPQTTGISKICGCHQTYELFTYNAPPLIGSGTLSIQNTGQIIGNTKQIALSSSTCTNPPNVQFDQECTIPNSAYQTISNIPRNATLTLTVSGGTFPITKTFQTPVTQHDFAYACNVHGCTFS